VPSVHDWIKAYGRAWEDRDDDAVGELFAPGAIYRSHPFREPLRGRDAIRTYWRQATGSLTGISLTFGRPITDGAHTSVEWWAILRSDQGTATLSGALNLAVRPGRPLRGTPRILAPRRGPRHPPRQTAGDGSAPRDRHASCRAERTGCSLLVYAFGGDTAHRHPMTCRRFGTTLAVPWHVARPDM